MHIDVPTAGLCGRRINPPLCNSQVPFSGLTAKINTGSLRHNGWLQLTPTRQTNAPLKVSSREKLFLGTTSPG